MNIIWKERVSETASEQEFDVSRSLTTYQPFNDWYGAFLRIIKSYIACDITHRTEFTCDEYVTQHNI